MGRRDFFVAVRRRRAKSAPPTERARSPGINEPHAAAAPAAPIPSAFPTATAGLEYIAHLLWLPCYEKLFELEFKLNLEAVGGSGYQMEPSTYRARLRGEAADRYDWRRMQQQRDQMAIALHANNQQHWSPSMLARSVTYFNLASEVIQREEGRQRRLASRPTTFQFLRMMRDCRPEPSWERGQHVSFFVADQTYEWVGMKKRGRRNTVERHDASGMPVEIKHEVYVNSVHVHLPSSLGTLSAADLATIAANHGSPYTEDYNNVFAPLDFATVDESLRELAIDSLAPVRLLVMGSATAAPIAPQQLSLSQIASALFGRPDIDPGGPSEFDILEALMETDTKSYDDFVKIFSHLSMHASPSSVVSIFAGDGQSVIRAKDMKRRWPHRYAHWLIGVGGFHEHAHSMFGFTEIFDDCFVRCCLDVLEIERVAAVTQDLEHNSYAHHQNAHHVITIAITSFLLQDVQYPPPQLFLRDPDAYRRQVGSAGGVVMLRYFRGAGSPTLQWQKAARTGKGETVKKLFAYSLHIFRTCHKPVCAQVVLIGLLGFCCALPALQEVLLAVVSLSLLGRKGGNMYVDRLLETINKIQQGAKRSSNAAAFARAIDMTTLLRSILHVRHAFQAAEGGSTETDDPITPSMLTQARLLQDFFLSVLGRDLTVHNPNNPFWHTGNAVPLHRPDFRTRRPWKYIQRVAEGRSAGRQRATPESATAYIRRFVFDHFFPF